MSNYNSELQSNNIDLQEILNAINELPDGGVTLPELTNPGVDSDLLLGKELIDQEGNTIVGSFTINDELSSQEDLLNQIKIALEDKAYDSALNFSVKAYPTEEALLADAPEENTIGIVTEHEVNNYALDFKNPYLGILDLKISANHTINNSSTTVTITDNRDDSVIVSTAVTGTASYSVFTDVSVPFVTNDGINGELVCSVRQTVQPFFIGSVIIDGKITGNVSFGTGTNSSYNWSGSQSVKNQVNLSNNDGNVWISLSSEGLISFNALKDNTMRTYPLHVEQCINSVFTDIEAKIYQNDEWVDFIATNILYKNGNENERVTGGWTTTALVIGGGSVNAHPTITRNESSMTISQDGSGRGGIVHTANKIKLTGKKSLVFKGDIRGTTSASASWWRIAIWSAFGTNSSQNVVAQTDIANINVTDTTITIDVSQLDSEAGYYIGIATYGTVATVTMKSLTLE